MFKGIVKASTGVKPYRQADVGKAVDVNWMRRSLEGFIWPHKFRTRNESLTKTVLTVIVATCTTFGFAAEISGEQAKLAIGNWITKDGSPMNARLGKRVRDAKTYADKSGAPLFHVVRLDGGGFIVTAADDSVSPIIAISEGDDLVADERNPLWVLLNQDLPQRQAVAMARKAQAKAAVAGMQGKGQLEPETAWSAALSGIDIGTLGVTYVSDVRVAPLVTSQWAQMAVSGLSCYNYYTPPYASGTLENYVCGCVATAGAQLMRYHRYPSGNVSAGSYRCFVDGVPTDLAMMGGVYNWDNMPLIPSSTGPTLAQRQAIGKLTHDVGVASYMKYTASESGALGQNLSLALTSRFGYANAVLILNERYGVDNYIENAILANLDAAQPSILGIKNSSGGGGHQIVADGYGYYIGDLAVHLNLGWSGKDDAWYFLPNIDSTPSYNVLKEIIYNISPSHGGEIISGRVLYPSGNPIAGASVVAINQTTGVTLPTVTSNSKGLYCLRVPKPSGSHVYNVTGYSGTYTMSQTVTVQASVSTQTEYNETTGAGTYGVGTGDVGNRWGVDLKAGQTKVIRIEGDLAFGSIAINTSSARSMVIYNDGNSALNVASISYPTGFSGDWGGGSIPEGSSKSVTVSFSPTAVKSYGGTITVASDKTSGTNTKACSGAGIQGADGVVIVSPVGNPPQVGESSVVFRGKAPIGSTRVGYVNSTTGSSNSSWDTVESDGTWGGRSINMDVGNNSITITSYNASGSVTGSKTLTVVRLSNIKTTSIGVTTCVAFFSGKPKTSYSTDSYVGYDSTGYGIERTLLQFVFPSLPKGSSVTGGQLRGVTQNDSSQQHGAAFNVTAYMVNAAWDSSANWNSFILGNSIPYVTNGASTQSVPGANSWVYWDVTSICQYWYGGTPNYGFMLKAESSVENGTDWHDRWFKPSQYQLTLTYSVETTPPTISITSPTANSSYSTSSATINLAGQATDSQNAVTVTWVNSLTGGNGSGTVNGISWNANGVTLAAGVNRIVVTATDAAGNASTDVIEVTYVPPAKIIRLSGTLDFGNVILGSQKTGEFYISNDGDTALTVTGITYPSGFSGGWSGGTIQAGGSQAVPVTFSPTLVQNYAGTVTVLSDKTSGENTKACSGTGLAVTKTIRIGGDLAFGNVVTNTSFAKNMTIHNDGNSPLTITGVTYPTGFSGNWAGGTIPAGKSCNIAVAFEPTVVQLYAGTITVNSDQTSGVNTIAPSGTGIAATRIIRLTGSLSFGDITESKTKTLFMTIHNDGNSDLTVSEIICPDGFTCGWHGAILSGGAAEVKVTFSPTAVKSYDGTITVNSDKTGGENTITCSGTGIAAIRRIRLAGNLNFGSAIEGEHVTRTLTIYNDGDSALTISGVELPAGFAGNWSGVILEGASTNVVITFTPTAAGIFGGSIVVNSDKTHGENTIECEGSGIGATRILILQGSLSFGVVTVGQSQTRTLTVHNDGNSTLMVSSFDCPNGFNASPESFTVGSNQTVNVSVIFAPGAVQAYSGTLQVQSDATAGDGTADCSGTGTLAIELPEAVDSTNLVWETDGDTEWFGQVNVTHDGIDAAQSGSVTNGQTSRLETTVTGPGQLSFWWKVSSEGGDTLQFMVNGVEQVAALSGETSWVQQKLQLEEGENVLQWRYIRNSPGNDSANYACVDQVVFSASHICPPAGDAELTTVGSYDGYLYADRAFGEEALPVVLGTLNVKLSKLEGRLTAKAVVQAGTVSFSGKLWTGQDGDGSLFTTLTTRGGETLNLYVRQNRIWGTVSGGKFGGGEIFLEGSRTRFADRKDAAAQEVLNRYKGYYTATLCSECRVPSFIQGTLNAAPHGYGYLTLTVSTGGKVKIAGILSDGTKVSQKAQLLRFADCGEWLCVPFFVPLYRKTGYVSGLFWIDPDTRQLSTDWETGWLMRWEKPGAGPDGFTGLLDMWGGYYNQPPLLYPQYVFESALDWDLCTYYYAGGVAPSAFEPETIPVTVSGSRMSMPRASRPVKFSGDGETWYEYEGDNPAGATLSFTARTGIFKGKFTLYYDYYDLNGRFQHKTVSVPYAGVMLQDLETGMLSDGAGHALFPANDPELKAYKIKPSFPVFLNGLTD